jgi:hypothetical protein
MYYFFRKAEDDENHLLEGTGILVRGAGANG